MKDAYIYEIEYIDDLATKTPGWIHWLLIKNQQTPVMKTCVETFDTRCVYMAEHLSILLREL